MKYSAIRIQTFILFLRNRVLNEWWTDQKYILKKLDGAQDDFPEFLHSVSQAEHQIGRSKQIKKITKEILENGYDGDVLEFGTWQGLGIILIAKSFGQDLGSRKIIGIDSFQGLPTSSSVWRKGQFSDTTVNQAASNIQNFAGNKTNFKLIEGLFNDHRTREKIYEMTNSVVMVHFDADLGTSTLEALSLVEKFLLNRKSPIFFLFDDWGNSPDEVPDAFYKWLNKAKALYRFEETKIGSTKFTRQYRLDFLS